MSTSLVRSINTSVSYSWTVSFTRDGVYLWIAQSSGATRQMFKSTDNWVSYEDVTSSFTNSQYLGSHTTTFLKEYVIGAHYENPVSGIEDVIRLYKWQDLISPTLTFDGYNQLSLTNTPTYRSSKLAYGSNVYDVGTLTDKLFIEKTGEYASLTFDTSSNVAYFSNVTVGTIINAPPSPSLTFDTYNKLSIENITPTATTLRLGSNTYEIGTASNVYIEDTGTYEIETKDANTFALVSNVVSGDIQPYTFMKNVQTIYGTSSSEQLGWSDNEGGGTICFNKDGTKLALSSYTAKKVYVYTLTNGTYVLDSGMPLTSSNHLFGYAVSLNDDGTILATNHFGGSNQQTGDTYVYQYSGGSWSLRATFGGGLYYTKASVLDGVGNRVLASAGGTNTMKIYDWNGTTYVETYSFSGSSEFAAGMDMTRDGLIVGGISKTTSDIVKVWQYSNGSWSQMGSDVSVGDMLPFFRLNRVGGTRFVTSNPDDDTAGTNYGILKVYDYANGSWTNTKTFYGDSTGTYLGWPIDISDDGTVIIAGGKLDDTKGTDAGMFYEFKEINGVWETKKFYDNVAGIQFGSGVAMNSTANVYAIGAGYDDTFENNAGKVVIYKSENVFSFDGYNKLSIQNITPTSTTLRLGSNTYDIGTASNVYIEHTGTDKVATGDATTFALVSNVVTGTISPHPTDAVPSLTFDTYNKLSIQNITPTSTTLRLGSNTYDIGTASNVYIEDTGTYKIETKDANTFALVSNVVTGTISPHPTDAVPSLTFDTYNKLSIENITPTATTLRLGSNTYEIGTASNVYIA